MTDIAAQRDVALTARRDLKMAKSVHAYVRGSTAQFYRWLQASPGYKDIPIGPPIWICGDCHLGNLGPSVDMNGRIEVQIRDLDQTIIGNPAHDLIRLGLSLETAARSSDLPGVTTAKMVEAMIDGYARAMTIDTSDDPPEPDVVRAVRRSAAGRRWRHLAKERIDGVDPNIPIGKRFWKLIPEERDAIDALFHEPKLLNKARRLAEVDARGKIRVVDAAYWRKGCSSLGRLRYAVLLGISRNGSKGERFAIVDVKEAVRPLAPIAESATMPRDPAERVVAGAIALAPNLGERMIAARILGKPVVLRELAPQDLKIEIEQFSHDDAVKAAAYLAFVVGVAHARQLTDVQRADWHRSLVRRPAGNLDAPSWLWKSIVDLAASHEAGYLEHCRKFAMT